MATTPGTEPILEAADEWKRRSLIHDQSMFTDESLWVPQYIAELDRDFVQKPDLGDRSFMEKLRDQLAGTSGHAKQLAAELLWVMALFPNNMGRDKKVEQVRQVWSWSGERLPDSHPLLVKPLASGIGSGGRAFHTLRWLDLSFFIRFLSVWKQLPIGQRERLAAEPWEFGRMLDNTEGSEGRQFRHMLLHLLFPFTYERVSSSAQRRKIDKRFSPELTDPSVVAVAGDSSMLALDRRLSEVRRALTAKYPGRRLDFYESPLVEQWRPDEEEEDVDKPASVTSSIQAGLERILSEYAIAREGDLFSGGHVLASAFRNIQNALEASPALQKRNTLRVKWSMGAGNWARVPWIAMMDPRETSTTQRGVYAVVLFRQDMSGVYLTLNQGVTEPRERLGRTGARGFVRTRAQQIRNQVGDLATYGFASDDRIDLRAEQGLGSEYEDSTIAYKLYSAGEVPEDTVILSDIETLLAAYDRYLAGRESEPPASQERWWVFQANPAYYDLPQAVKALSSLSWEVKQHAGEIKSGQRVFLWESGSQAGLVALATIISDPASTTMPSNEVPYVNDETRFASRELRVQLHVNEVLPTRLLRRDLLNLPGLRELSILRGPQGTNFRVQQEEAEVLLSLLKTGPGAISLRPRADLSAVVKSLSASMVKAHLRFGARHEELVRVFISSLAAKRFLILTGLSGSGKTQLALRFGEWVGEERHRIIAVRPDWTGPEALLGYEDALLPAADGARAWHVPEALAFMLRAASDPTYPYVLVLDEMNLAHVERYFADILSGMESGAQCLPNLLWHAGAWRRATTGPALLRFPDNLFLIGTVNVDETTYMFSPKVLDRANTIEFRVESNELNAEAQKPEQCEEGPQELVAGFLQVARDDDWHTDHPAPGLDDFRNGLLQLHTLLTEGGFEFGHRVFYEAIRFSAMLSAAGDSDSLSALDFQLLQKVLPRLHGSRRRLEPTVAALLQFCLDVSDAPNGGSAGAAASLSAGTTTPAPKLPRSYKRLTRILRGLHTNQFASFSE